jgi:hypothetical protein
MPSGKIHLMVGAIAANLSSLVLISGGPLSLKSAVFYSILLWIGSVFPDADIEGSLIGKWLIGACFMLSTLGAGILAKFTDLPMPGLFAVGFVITIALESVLRLLKHRGRLHEPVFEMLLTIVFALITGFFIENYSFALKIFLGFYLGTLLHITMDFFPIKI